MDIEHILVALRLTNKRVISKSKELNRLVSVRQPQGLGSKMEICRGSACAELAARLYKQPFDRALAIKMCGCSESIYVATISHLQVILDMRPKVSISELCIRLGCVTLAYDAQLLFDHFIEEETKTVQPIERQHLDFSLPVYPAAAVFVTAQAANLKLKQKQLITICCSTSKQFSIVVKKMSPMISCLTISAPTQETSSPDPACLLTSSVEPAGSSST